MGVHLVHELVEIVLVSGAEIDEGLDCLIGIGGDVQLAGFVDDLGFLVSLNMKERGEDTVLGSRRRRRRRNL